MQLRAGRRRQRGALGTYCWGDATEGCCVDMAGPQYPADSLYLYLNEAPELHFRDLNPVSELTYTIWPSRIVAIEQGFAWEDDVAEQPIRQQTLARPAGLIRLPGNLPHGLYLIDVFALASGGDTSQGFRIYVGPETRVAMHARIAGTPWPAPVQP
jgi:hypothetical protein